MIYQRYLFGVNRMKSWTKHIEKTTRSVPVVLKKPQGPSPWFLNIPELRRSDILVTFEEFAEIAAGAEACFFSYILNCHFSTG